MNSLLDFITLTKGTEYLIAIAFLFAFVGFWQLAQHQGRGLAVRVVPFAAMALVFGALASTCISPRSVATAGEQQWPSVDSAHYLANIYGPAKFAAHEMGPEIVSCQTCHHHSPDGKPAPCSDCHSTPFDGENLSKPGLKAAYHQRCADCHKEAFEGPMTCTSCHTEKAQTAEFKKKSPSPVTPPSITHSLLDRYGNCLTCHNPEGPLPLPGNHSGYNANVVCLGCHKPSAQEAVSSIPTPFAASTPPATATPAPSTEATAAPRAAAGKITHPIAGRENCSMCHKQGAAGPAKLPDDHAGRANDSCQLCHKPS